MMFISEYGGQAGWEWIPIQVLRRICDALDKPQPLGNDYRMFAEVLDVHENNLQQIIRFCATTRNQSLTREILRVGFSMFCFVFVFVLFLFLFFSFFLVLCLSVWGCVCG